VNFPFMALIALCFGLAFASLVARLKLEDIASAERAEAASDRRQ
jgi:hypothetical protein